LEKHTEKIEEEEGGEKRRRKETGEGGRVGW